MCQRRGARFSVSPLALLPCHISARFSLLASMSSTSGASAAADSSGGGGGGVSVDASALATFSGAFDRFSSGVLQLAANSQVAQKR